MLNKLILIFFLFSLSTFGQKRKKNPYNPWEWGCAAGYIYQGQSFGEIGILRAKFPKSSTIQLGYSGYQFGADFNFSNKNFIIGPKVSFEYVLMILSARANLTCNTNFRKADLRFTPEIGFSYGGICTIYYGYNIPLNNSEFKEISRNRISLVFDLIPYNLPRRGK